MDTTRDREEFRHRLRVADLVADTQISDAKLDAEIVLCCAFSALASQIWPGEGKDKQRFVQLLVELAPATMKISVPALASDSERRHLNSQQR